MIASRFPVALLFRRIKQSGLSAVVVGLAMTLSLAAAPTFWRVSTQAEFLRGEVEALSVDADGHLGLGPVTETFFDTTAPVLWSLVTATDDALWIGSGNDGRVYRVDPSGRGEMVFNADASDVYALAAAPNGAVFAATSPDGLIYRVTPDGTASPLFDPDATYVSCMRATPRTCSRLPWSRPVPCWPARSRRDRCCASTRVVGRSCCWTRHTTRFVRSECSRTGRSSWWR